MKVLVGFDHYQNIDGETSRVSSAKVLVVAKIDDLPEAFEAFIASEKANWNLFNPQAKMTWYLPEEKHEVYYLSDRRKVEKR